MIRYLSLVLIFGALTKTVAQQPTATASDVEALRQEVKSLTETVKALQQQVKDQQSVVDMANIGGSSLPQSAEATPFGSPAASPAAQFATNDSSVVATAPAAAPKVNANGAATSAFPTNDDSVLASTASPSSSSIPPVVSSGEDATTGPSTGAISFGGDKTYMNISFDGQFALSYSRVISLTLKSAITIRSSSAALMRATRSWKSATPAASRLRRASNS